VDIVDGDQVVDSLDFLARDLCGETWGLTLSNPWMHSQQPVLALVIDLGWNRPQDEKIRNRARKHCEEPGYPQV